DALAGAPGRLQPAQGLLPRPGDRRAHALPRPGPARPAAAGRRRPGRKPGPAALRHRRLRPARRQRGPGRGAGRGRGLRPSGPAPAPPGPGRRTAAAALNSRLPIGVGGPDLLYRAPREESMMKRSTGLTALLLVFASAGATAAEYTLTVEPNYPPNQAAQ